MQRVNLRDAVVHSSPKLINDETPKMRNLIEMQIDDATAVADAAIDFVKLIDDEINHGKYDNAWLLRRTVNGPFPAESFV